MPVVDAHMHIFGAPNWLPGFEQAAPGEMPNVGTWPREVRWYDDLSGAPERFRRTIADCWDPDGAQTIARMDAAGVDASVMMPMDHGLLVQDQHVIPIREKNRLCAELTRRHPRRLFILRGRGPAPPRCPGDPPSGH